MTASAGPEPTPPALMVGVTSHGGYWSNPSRLRRQATGRLRPSTPSNWSILRVGLSVPARGPPVGCPLPAARQAAGPRTGLGPRRSRPFELVDSPSRTRRLLTWTAVGAPSRTSGPDLATCDADFRRNSLPRSRSLFRPKIITAKRPPSCGRWRRYPGPGS